MGLGKSRSKHSCQTQLPYMFTKALEKHTEICQFKGAWYASLTLLSHARNAGNRISELLNFQIFWGSMPPDPPRKGHSRTELNSHSRLLLYGQTPTSNLIESPAYVQICKIIYLTHEPSNLPTQLLPVRQQTY